jgi:hypothetical protein
VALWLRALTARFGARLYMGMRCVDAVGAPSGWRHRRGWCSRQFRRGRRDQRGRHLRERGNVIG